MSIAKAEEVLADYYLYKDAVKEIGVTKPTVWRWIKKGKVEILRVGREILIEKSEVERLRSGQVRGGKSSAT